MATEDKMGKLEAFSFKKQVVKINNDWYKYDEEVGKILKDAVKDENVRFTVNGHKITSLEILSDDKPKQEQKETKQYNNDYNIRMSALKSTIALTTVYKFKDTQDILEIAKRFEEYISTGKTEGQTYFLERYNFDTVEEKDKEGETNASA